MGRPTEGSAPAKGFGIMKTHAAVLRGRQQDGPILEIDRDPAREQDRLTCAELCGG